MIKVSVIIPVYGVEKYIERCANSLFAQTLDNIEFIFIDDCTPDRSMEILSTVIEKNRPRFEGMNWIVRTKRILSNSGQAAVRQYGVKLAKGKYVIHCDSDDWVAPEMYQLMYEKAIVDDSDIVVCDYITTDGVNVIKTYNGCRTNDRDEFINRLLFQYESWSLCNKLVNRIKCYNNINFPNGNMGEDMALSIQLLLNCNRVSFVPKELYFYYSNPESITQSPNEEKKMRNFFQNKENVDLICGVFDRLGKSNVYAKGILYIKWRVKRQLWNTTFDKSKYTIWLNTYREISKGVIFCKKIPFAEKVKYFLTFLRLYPCNAR